MTHAKHEHYTRAKDLQYRAAGVLPLSVVGNKVFVLLGGERSRSSVRLGLPHQWRDFGGHREAIDVDPESTAAREFSEETLGLFGGCSVDKSSVAASSQAMAERLRTSINVFRISSPMRRGNYCMFVTQVPYIDSITFHVATQENESRGGVAGAEKSSFMWVRASSLLQAVQRSGGKGGRGGVVHVCAGGGVGRGKSTRRLPLHTPFVNTLRKALASGLSDFLLSCSVASSDKESNLSGAPTPTPTPAVATTPAPTPSPEHMLFWVEHIRSSGTLNMSGCATSSLPVPLPSRGKGRKSAKPDKSLEVDTAEKFGPASASVSNVCGASEEELGSAVAHAAKLKSKVVLLESHESGDHNREQEEEEKEVRILECGGVSSLHSKSRCEGGGMEALPGCFAKEESLFQVAGDAANTASENGQKEDEFCASESWNLRCGPRDAQRRHFLASFPVAHRGAVANAFHNSVRNGYVEPESVVEALLATAATKREAMQEKKDNNNKCGSSRKSTEEEEGPKRPWEFNPAILAGERSDAAWLALEAKLTQDAASKASAYAYAQSVVEWETLGTNERSRLKRRRRGR